MGFKCVCVCVCVQALKEGKDSIGGGCSCKENMLCSALWKCRFGLGIHKNTNHTIGKNYK